MPTEQELKEHYEQAPTEVKHMLTSPETANDIKAIAEKNGLDDIHTELLLNEVGLVLLGIEDKESFAPNLVEVLEISESIARTVAAQIDGAIFSRAATKAPATPIQRVQIDRTSRNTSVSQTQNTPPPITEPKESPTATPQRDVPQTDQTSILKVLRENGKTLNIKNIIENLK